MDVTKLFLLTAKGHYLFSHVTWLLFVYGYPIRLKSLRF